MSPLASPHVQDISTKKALGEFFQALSAKQTTVVWKTVRLLSDTMVDKIVVDDGEVCIDDDRDVVLKILTIVTRWLNVYVTTIEQPIVSEDLLHIAKALHGKDL